jgi:flagellar biogenesis protein FliO
VCIHTVERPETGVARFGERKGTGGVTIQSLRLLRTLGTLLLAALCAATVLEKAAAAAATLPETTTSASSTSAATSDRTGTAAGPTPILHLGRPDQPLKLGTPDSPNGSLIWQSLAAILVILFLGGVGLYVVKRIRPRIAQARGKKIRLLESFHLGQQKTLFLMEVGNQRLLLGVSRDNLRLVADVTASVPPSSEGEGETRAKFVIPSLDSESPGTGSGGRAAS